MANTLKINNKKSEYPHHQADAHDADNDGKDHIFRIISHHRSHKRRQQLGIIQYIQGNISLPEKDIRSDQCRKDGNRQKAHPFLEPDRNPRVLQSNDREPSGQKSHQSATQNEPQCLVIHAKSPPYRLFCSADRARTQPSPGNAC